MQLHVNEKARLLEIWLSSTERDDAALRDSLDPLLTASRAKKYRPVFYLSGDGDLRESTAALLRARRRRMNAPAGAPENSTGIAG